MEFFSRMSDALGNNVTVHLACDDNGWSGTTNWTTNHSVKVGKLLLAACGLFAAVAAAQTKAVTELPGITVTGNATPPGDIVNRDRDQRSPDIHWPTTLSLKWSEMFAHNQIEINAPCATVWNHLVQAQLWPQWCSFAGKVKINGGSPILQKNTKFSWRGLDLPQDNIAVFQHSPEPLVSKVIEYVPERRIGWYSFGTPTEHDPLCATYHTWLLTPIGAKKCLVTFEEVATGRAARYARGVYPEVVHLSHQRWLQELKKVSEAHN
jgi:Polyketide cyclase / dehydrase and lipid transport